MNKIVVGLTGGICGGKSKAADMLLSLGFAVVDADEISRKVTARGTDGERLLAENFPEAAEGGVIDRRKLREIVFGDGASLEKLNALTHPLIASEMKAEIEACGNSLVLAVVPLLFEAGFDKLCDYTVTVSCDENIRIERLMKRDNIGEALARRIAASQMPDAEKERRADVVIYNDRDEEYLFSQVKRIFSEMSAKADENKNEKR